MDPRQRSELAKRLSAALRPFAEPIGIRFLAPGATTEAPAFAGRRPAPNAAGRTGTVAAGCVFWIAALAGAIATEASDHANCSVGSYTHGFLSLDEAAQKDDVAAVLESGWVDAPAVAALPHVAERPERIVYGPLASFPGDPDVVLVRLSGVGLMTLRAAYPDLRIEGKPQCHIVALAKEAAVPAASVGCALSRARTGMKPEEMTCALPGADLAAIVDRIEAAATLDRAMARYASTDAKRFARE
jgi:uncharacterized protein (DUF169 family)